MKLMTTLSRRSSILYLATAGMFIAVLVISFMILSSSAPKVSEGSMELSGAHAGTRLEVRKFVCVGPHNSGYALKDSMRIGIGRRGWGGMQIHLSNNSISNFNYSKSFPNSSHRISYYHPDSYIYEIFESGEAVAYCSGGVREIENCLRLKGRTEKPLPVAEIALELKSLQFKPRAPVMVPRFFFDINRRLPHRHFPYEEDDLEELALMLGPVYDRIERKIARSEAGSQAVGN